MEPPPDPRREQQLRSTSKPTFVFIEHPQDTKDARFKRQVRTHVTRAQHRKTRERTRQAIREQISAGPNSDARHGLPQEGLVPPWRLQQESVGESSSAMNTRNTSESQDHSQQAQPDTYSSTASSDVRSFAERLAGGMLDSGNTSLEDALVHPGSNLGKSFSRGVMAFRTFALNDSTNVVGVSLSQLELDVAVVLGCYEFIVKIQSQDFERRYADDQVIKAGSGYPRFMSFLFTDPVLLNVAILITTQFLLASRGKSLLPKELYSVLQLRGLLITNINSALSDPVRAISDQMLVAVIIFAAHELHYASIEAYHVHMNGLVRMVNVRGGMAQLGSQDPYLERMLIWHDANASKQAGCEPYVQKVDKPSILNRPKANAEMFRMTGSYTPR